LCKTVCRPDSGDPVKIICGDGDAKRYSPEYNGTIEELYRNFPDYDTLNKNYCQLDHVGVIYGDSINLKRAYEILSSLKQKEFASNVIVFGVGSYAYQYVTRDTFGCAVKATYGVVNNKPRNISKKPKTDDGMKNSASGLLRVEYEDGNYILYQNQTPEQEQQGELKTVFENGDFINLTDFGTIRARIDNEINVIMKKEGLL
jgi:nicotinamide phosphoribosyltransferase